MNQRILLVGGGLANSLIAWRLRQVDPDVELVLLEREPQLGGNHVWCFHHEDLTPEQRAWMTPLIERSWDGYQVRFPSLVRRLSGGYYAVTSDRLHREVTKALGTAVRLGCDVREVRPREVDLADGSTLRGDLVLDGRGARVSESLTVAFQKFVGQWLELEQDHGLTEPILMDATVEQLDGYRFFYTLPLSDRILHVEDTRYSDGPDLDLTGFQDAIARYAATQGWTVAHVKREEQGVLPIVLEGDIHRYWEEGHDGVACSGMRAALFHPTTGYSLPEAVRLADALPERLTDGPIGVSEWIRARSEAVWRQGRYFRMLNRMLFRAADPSERYRVLQRFYGLPEPLIQRFYGGELSIGDRLRILVGRPPVPIRRALGCMFEAGPSA